MIMLALFVDTAMAAASTYSLKLELDVSKAGFERGGVVGIKFTAVDAIPVTASGFSYGIQPPSSASWLQNTDDIYNPPSARGVECKSSASNSPVYATMTVGSASGLEVWAVHFNTNIPASTVLTCYTRWNFLVPTDKPFTPGTPQVASEAPSRSAFTITPTFPTGSVNFSAPSVTFSKVDYVKDFSKLHMGWMDQSYIEFTATGLLQERAIPISLYPVFSGISVSGSTLVTWQNTHTDDTLSLYNVLGVVCDQSKQVRLYISQTNQLFLVTGTTKTTDSVKCKIPFPWNILNRLQTYSDVDKSVWVKATSTWLVYVANAPSVSPTESNSVSLTNLQYEGIIPSLFQVTYSKCGGNECATAQGDLILEATSSKISAKLINQGSGFTPTLSTILAATTTTLTSQLNTPVTVAWDNNGEVSLTSVNAGQIAGFQMVTTLSSAMLTSTFALQLTITSGSSTQKLIIYYQPPIEMDPTSQVDTATFTTEQYTINYKLRYADSSTTYHSFPSTATVSKTAFNLYMEPNLETRGMEIDNTVPICTFTSTTNTSLQLTVERRYRSGLPLLDLASNRYYYLTIQDAKVGDLFNLKCDYKIIVTKTNFFPAPVDLLNYVEIRDMTSSTVSQLGWPQVIDWKVFWDPFKTGPNIKMATEGRPNLCFVIVGPEGVGSNASTSVDSQTNLDTWIQNWLNLVKAAPTIDGGANWFVDQGIDLTKLHWSWALSYYFGRGFLEESHGLFGTNGLNTNSFTNSKVHINSLNAMNSMIWICGPNDTTKVVDGYTYPNPIVDTPIPNASLLDNTLFREATAANNNYYLHSVQVGKDQATLVGFYYEQNVSFFDNYNFLPVLNTAMGTPCKTTPQTQAQGIDVCYNGFGTSWFELPGEYLQWTRSYKTLTYAATPVKTFHTAEQYNFDVFTWKSKTLEDEGGSTTPPECQGEECGEHSGSVSESFWGVLMVAAVMVLGVLV